MKAHYTSPEVECIEFGSRDVLTPSDPQCPGHCPNHSCPNYEEGIGCLYNAEWCPDD